MGLAGAKICFECSVKEGKIVQMKPLVNGVVVHFKDYYHGFHNADLYCCPKCGFLLLTSFGEEWFPSKREVTPDITISKGGSHLTTQGAMKLEKMLPESAWSIILDKIPVQVSEAKAVRRQSKGEDYSKDEWGGSGDTP